MVTNPLKLLCIWECLNFTSLLDCLPDIGFFDDIFFFSFSTLNILAHCLLVSKVSDEKSAGILTEDLLYSMSHFSSAPFKILFTQPGLLWLLFLNRCRKHHRLPPGLQPWLPPCLRCIPCWGAEIYICPIQSTCSYNYQEDSREEMEGVV